MRRWEWPGSCRADLDRGWWCRSRRSCPRVTRPPAGKLTSCRYPRRRFPHTPSPPPPTRTATALSAVDASTSRAATAIVDEVDEDVVAQALAVDEEGPAPVEPGQALDEVAQVVVGLEHETVDGESLLGAPLHLHQGAAEGFLDRRVGKDHAATVVEMSGRLAVGDHDDL